MNLTSVLIPRPIRPQTPAPLRSNLGSRGLVKPFCSALARPVSPSPSHFPRSCTRGPSLHQHQQLQPSLCGLGSHQAGQRSSRSTTTTATAIATRPRDEGLIRSRYDSSTRRRISSSTRPFGPAAMSDDSGVVDKIDWQVSAGHDDASVIEQAEELRSRGWRACNGGKGLERQFAFKTFKTTWAFMTTVAEQCKSQRHHPEWTNIYNRVHIRWTTHEPQGLSSKDIHMAKFCDERASELGELTRDGADQVGRIATGEGSDDPTKRIDAGDCCARPPASKKLS